PDAETARIRTALDKIGPIIAERKNHVRARDLAHTRERWIDGLKGFSTQSAAYPIVKLLRNALRTGDYDGYVEGHTRLREVEAITDEVARRRALLDRLDAAAPDWAAALRTRAAPHHRSEPPGSLAEALAYRLLDQALAQLHTLDLEDLLAQLARIDQ